MKILAIGDIVGLASLSYLREKLWGLRRELSVDFVIANGENVCDIHGIGVNEAKELFSLGVDMITSGNHVFSRREIGDYMDGEGDGKLLRPCNYPVGTPGSGYGIVCVDGFKLLVINALGCVFMESMASPFESVDAILKRESGHYDIAILDFHAEATSEKLAMARYFDGRIHIIFGTHTHVQTADEQILPHGSAYITDLGMTGPSDGILGVESACVLNKFLTKMPSRFRIAEGRLGGQGALFDIDPSMGSVKSVRRIHF